MPTIVTYSLISLLFTFSYTFTLLALLLPHWLLFVTPRPYRTYQNYGLFKRCSNTMFNDECRPFPSSDYNDCQEKYFCEEWGLAATTMILASIVGCFAWFDLVGVIIGGRLKRERSWKRISGIFIIHATLQFVTIFIIAHLYTISERFYFGVKYDYSFVLANVSACFSVILAITLFLNGLFAPPEYATLR